MKISEVIKKLQKIQKEHGDLHVWVDYNEINDNNFNKKLLSMNLWGILLIPLYSFNPVFTRAFRVILLFNYITVANSCELKQNRYISLKTLGIISIELIFALASFYMFDINNDGLRQMIYPIFQNNILLN